MSHEFDQKPQIDILTSEKENEPVKIEVKPAPGMDNEELSEKVAEVKGNIEAVVDSGVFVHWAEPDKQPLKLKVNKPVDTTEPVAGYDAIFAKDTAMDDGAGVPMPHGDDFGGGGDDDGGGAPAKPPGIDSLDDDPYGERRRREEEEDDAEPPPSDDDDDENPEVV